MYNDNGVEFLTSNAHPDDADVPCNIVCPQAIKDCVNVVSLAVAVIFEPKTIELEQALRLFLPPKT